MTDAPLRVVIWTEPTLDDKGEDRTAHVYPAGIPGALADGLRQLRGDEVAIQFATLTDAEHGLTSEVLDETDVLVWWGHFHHEAVSDDVVERVVERVDEGMGLVALHSAQGSRVLRRLLGTSCDIAEWRDNETETLWVVNPGHPIAQGIGRRVVIPEQEMYSEFFDIPAPDELVFISSFTGGEVFRSGCCFRRGQGKIFYFSPGHEAYPVFHHPEVRRIIANAVFWAGASDRRMP